MKIAYLVLAHDNPKHLERLVIALSHESCALFLHIDRKSILSDFSGVTRKNVHLSAERIPVYWGDFSQVEAILVLLRMALGAREPFDYFVLLSGTDYPIQPASYIWRFFERNRGTEFINIVRMPCEAVGKPLSRLTTYVPSPAESKIVRTARRLLTASGVTPRQRDYKPYLRNLDPYAGSEWWALTRQACEHIHHFVERERRVVTFFRNTVCPDESFFQTILGNSPHAARVRRNLTFADWSGGGANPAYITESHLPFLTRPPPIILDDAYGKGEILFARKFSDAAEEIVARIRG